MRDHVSDEVLAGLALGLHQNPPQNQPAPDGAIDATQAACGTDISSLLEDPGRPSLEQEMCPMSPMSPGRQVGGSSLSVESPQEPLQQEPAFEAYGASHGEAAPEPGHQPVGTFSEDIIANVANQVLRGLCYLHGLKIVHRDIKPANLLLNSKMEVKVADFGVSKIMSEGGLRRCSSYVGTHGYMSPERFDPGSHGGCYDGFAGDVWSLGITLWELYVGHFPLLPSGQRPDWATLMYAICFGEIPDFPDNASHHFRDFLSCCLHKYWSERATVSDLLSHPFVTGEPPATQVQ